MSHEINILKNFSDKRYTMVHIDYDAEKWSLILALFETANKLGQDKLNPPFDVLRTRKVPLWFCLGSSAPRNWSNSRDEADLVNRGSSYIELSFECFYYMLFNFLRDYQG